MKASGFIRELPGIVAPLVITLVIMGVALRLLNAAPAYLQNMISGPPPPQYVLDERLTYPSVEAAEEDLGVTVRTPAYFPSYLVWPASSVRAQREPAKVISLLFRSGDSAQGLQIREVFWPEEELPFPIPEPLAVRETRDVDVSGARGKLLLGSGQADTVVNQLRWKSGDVHFVVTTIYPPEELLRIGRSMR